MRICGATNWQDEVASWLMLIETLTYEELANRGEYPDVDAKVAVTLIELCTEEFGREIHIEVERLRLEGLFMAGRQMLKKIYEQNATDVKAGAIHTLEDLMNVRLDGDNLIKFQNDWNGAMGGQNQPRRDQDLLVLYLRAIKKSKRMDIGNCNLQQLRRR